MNKVILNNYRIFVHDSVMQIFSKYRTSEIPEAGGILLGQVRKDEIYVLKITEPSRWDIRRMFGFVRNKKSAQQAINIEFKKSGRRTIYLGEWHSHPQANPYPSVMDIQMIEKQYKYNEINECFLLMIIVGINQDYISLYDGKQLFEN